MWNEQVFKLEKFIYNHLAGGKFALTEDEKNHGTAFIDIGGGSTTIAIFR